MYLTGLDGLIAIKKKKIDRFTNITCTYSYVSFHALMHRDWHVHVLIEKTTVYRIIGQLGS